MFSDLIFRMSMLVSLCGFMKETIYACHGSNLALANSLEITITCFFSK